MNTAFFLEILNGGAVTPELIWLCIITVYLARESSRRGLHPLDWFHLPPSMNLILAVFIFDAAIVGRSWVIWAWRRFDGGTEFAPWHVIALIITGLMILAGTLCKIRAMTHPDLGNGPWYVACGATALGIVALIIF